MFDVQALMDMQVEGENSTVSIPVPEGEYRATSTKVEPRSWQSKDGSMSGVSLDITWDIDDPALKDITGRDKNVVRQSIGLDFTESGQLDMSKGRNVALGRLRDACNLNNPGQRFNFSQLVGQYCMVYVKHRAGKDGDDTIYAEVKSVAKVS